jgi:hypothetical protein
MPSRMVGMADIVDLVAENVLQEVARLFVGKSGDRNGALRDTQNLEALRHRGSSSYGHDLVG